MGHAIVGMLSDHDKLIKVVLNLWSTKNPGYTLFATGDDMQIYTEGKLMAQGAIKNSLLIVDVSTYEAGIYILSINNFVNLKFSRINLFHVQSYTAGFHSKFS